MCSKGVHFTFNGEIFTKIDRVAMESPLAPILAGIFMVKLEKKFVWILLP